MTDSVTVRVGFFSEEGIPMREHEWFDADIPGRDRAHGDDAELARFVINNGDIPVAWFVFVQAGRGYVLVWMTGETNSRVVFDSRKNDGRYDDPPKPDPRSATIAFGAWDTLIDLADDAQRNHCVWNDMNDAICDVRANAVVPVLCEWLGENGDDRAADLLGEGRHDY